jgi:PAS domain S-box-containing protein
MAVETGAARSVGADSPEATDRAFAAALAETSQCLVCVLDSEGRIVRFNRACEQATGFSRDDVLGRDARDIVIPPEDREIFGEFLAEVWATGRPSPKEGEWLTADGGRRLVAWANEPVLGADGEVKFLVTTGLDITERELKAAKLRRLAEEQRVLRRVATLIAGEAEPEEVFQTVTEEVCRLFGIASAITVRFESAESAVIVGRWSAAPVEGFEIGSLIRLEEGLAMTSVLRTGAPARVDGYERIPGDLARAVREVGFQSTVAVPISLAGATWGALVAALREGETVAAETESRMADFAELVSLALASADAREKLAASRARIVEAGDAERRRLERNLHDGAQQRLVTVSLALGLLRARLEDEDASTAAPLLERATEELRYALEELRELARGLHPAVLRERGLGPALETLAARAPFPVEVDEIPSERLPEQVEAAIYFIVSEALANAAKHARARSVTAGVRRENGRVLVEIADDGRGGADVSRGSGLRGLVGRVEALDGRLSVESPPGKGTVVRAELPLPR